MSLKSQYIQSYWDDRAAKSGAGAVGFNASTNREKQAAEYLIKREFIRQHLSTESISFNTLDYGCGVGNMSEIFDPRHYIGADITKFFLDCASQSHPKYHYRHLSEPWFSNVDLRPKPFRGFRQVFTSTVLQHCDDSSVKVILESMREELTSMEEKGNLQFVLYELDNESEKSHVKARSTKEYADIISDCEFDVKECQSFYHVVHGEKHTLSIIETERW